MIDQVAIPFVHAAGSVLFGGIYDLVGLALDLLIDSDIFFLPASRLRVAGEDKNQLDVRILLLELKDHQFEASVRTDGSAAAKETHPRFYQPNKRRLQPPLDKISIGRAEVPVTGKATSFFSHY